MNEESWEPTVIVYHANCDDGFAARTACAEVWPAARPIPGSYGQSLPDLKDEHVLFVDFSLRKTELGALARINKTVVVIDHHKTAQEELDAFQRFDGRQSSLMSVLDLDRRLERNIAVWFDMDQSGAMMAWQFATNSDRMEAPLFYQLIEDRDLWRFKFSVTKAFSAGLRAYPYDVQMWKEFIYNPQKLMNEGRLVLQAHQKNLNNFIESHQWAALGVHNIPVVNVPYHYASDAANELLQRYPEAKYAVAWFVGSDLKVRLSLRSEDHREDVGAVARAMNGGGHRNAAGAACELEDWVQVLRPTEA